MPRERFVAPEQAEHAYENRPLPVGAGQTISQPLVVAMMCELLDVRPGDRVLDVGTGSGWHAALLATLGGRVWSIERHPQLSQAAGAALAAAGIAGVELVVGDGSRGLPEHAPYDAINVAAASSGGIPRALEDQLGRGGRLVVPVGGVGGQRLMLVRRGEDGGLRRRDAGGVRFVPLVED